MLKHHLVTHTISCVTFSIARMTFNVVFMTLGVKVWRSTLGKRHRASLSDSCKYRNNVSLNMDRRAITYLLTLILFVLKQLLWTWLLRAMVERLRWSSAWCLLGRTITYLSILILFKSVWLGRLKQFLWTWLLRIMVELLHLCWGSVCSLLGSMNIGDPSKCQSVNFDGGSGWLLHPDVTDITEFNNIVFLLKLIFNEVFFHIGNLAML